MSIRKSLIAGAVMAAAVFGVFAPAPAQAWWVARPGWGWHAGWGWRGGVYLPLPPVVVGAPVVVAPHRWVPPHYTPYGVYVPGHWAY